MRLPMSAWTATWESSFQLEPQSVVTHTKPLLSRAQPWSRDTKLAETAPDDGALGAVVGVVVVVFGVAGRSICTSCSAWSRNFGDPSAVTCSVPWHHETNSDPSPFVWRRRVLVSEPGCPQYRFDASSRVLPGTFPNTPSNELATVSGGCAWSTR